MQTFNFLSFSVPLESVNYFIFSRNDATLEGCEIKHKKKFVSNRCKVGFPFNTKNPLFYLSDLQSEKKAWLLRPFHLSFFPLIKRI